MNRKIAVLCGGISPESEVSKVSGKNVYEALKKNFDTTLIVLEKNEVPSGLKESGRIVYPALHGDYGEDGTLQSQLDALGVEYAGCGALSSRVCMVKPAAKALMKFASLPVARSLDFSARAKPSAKTVCELFPNGAIIKPADKGSSVGLSVVKNATEAEKALESITDGEWMAEEFFDGREFSVGVVYGKAAGVVEIKPQGGVYDFKRKYTAGSTVYEFPAHISDTQKRTIQSAAETAYKACGCRDFCRVDFRMNGKSEYVILEINTLPGMTPTSLLPKSVKCLGTDFDELCALLMEGAFARADAKDKA